MPLHSINNANYLAYFFMAIASLTFFFLLLYALILITVNKYILFIAFHEYFLTICWNGAIEYPMQWSFFVRTIKYPLKQYKETKRKINVLRILNFRYYSLFFVLLLWDSVKKALNRKIWSISNEKSFLLLIHH